MLSRVTAQSRRNQYRGTALRSGLHEFDVAVQSLWPFGSAESPMLRKGWNSSCLNRGGKASFGYAAAKFSWGTETLTAPCKELFYARNDQDAASMSKTGLKIKQKWPIVNNSLAYTDAGNIDCSDL